MKAKILHITCLASLAFLGCELPSEGQHDASANGAPSSGQSLPEGTVAYYNGTELAASSYDIAEGVVLVEGDIALGTVDQVFKDPAAAAGPSAKTSSDIMTTAMPGQANHWTAGRIPYVIFNESVRATAVKAAIKEWNQKAPVIWVPKTSADVDYVRFVDVASGPSNSSVGRVGGGGQNINVAPGAGKAAMMHEMGHASGLYHEQSRSDRTSNINVTTTNAALLNTADFGVFGASVGPFDFNSLMLYGAGTTYFTYDGVNCKCWVRATNVTPNSVTLSNKAGMPTMQPGSTLSAGDLLGLRGIYMNATAYNPSTAKSLSTDAAWPTVKTFKAGSSHFVLHYNPADGQFRTYTLTSSGGLSTSPTFAGVWNAGWTQIEFYVLSGQTYAMFYNGASGYASLWAFNADGSLGANIENQYWNGGWDIMRVYRPAGGSNSFFFLYNKSSGRADIWGMKANGALDLANYTYTNTWYGYEDFEIADNVLATWHYSGTDLFFNSSYLLFHDKESSTQFIMELFNNGTVGQWVTTTGVGTGYDFARTYNRYNRTEALYYKKSTGEVLICDLAPVYTGNSPTLTAGNLNAVRKATFSTNYVVANITISPYGSDPVGAEWFIGFQPTAKYFWTANLMPYPSI
jgi:hypothetical protein